MIAALFLAFALEAPRVSLEAPDFDLPVIQGDGGRLSDYRGKVVLLHFFATWCLPCREEMPALERLYQAFKDEGLVVIGIAADRDERAVRRYIAELAIGFPILWDGKGEVRRTYEVVGLPQSYLIGRDGRFLGRAIGARGWDSPEAIAYFQQLLKEDTMKQEKRDFLRKSGGLLLGGALGGLLMDARAGEGPGIPGYKMGADTQGKCITCRYWGGIRYVTGDGHVIAQSLGWCNNPKSKNYHTMTTPETGPMKSWRRWEALS